LFVWYEVGKDLGANGGFTCSCQLIINV